MRSSVLTALCLALAAAVPAAAATCSELAAKRFPDARIDGVQVVAPGAFVPPGGAGNGPNPYANLPEFCRVRATLTPSYDSDIKVEVWLPTNNWNGKFQAVGNGGWAGIISYSALGQALERGYATSSTDTGHVGGRGTFALDHPEKLIDYAYRSVHEMTVKAKDLIADFYGSPARYSYWVGCSTGGKQGLTEAQRYPDDFDGIVAGAPANYMIHLHLWSIWVNQAVNKTPNSFLGPAEHTLLKTAVMAKCDALDGVTDGVLENPRACNFDPSLVACTPTKTTGCLNQAQLVAARQAYSPAKNTRTGELVFPQLEPGSEGLWPVLMSKEPNSIPADTFRYVIFKDPEWDPMTLNMDEHVQIADEVDGGLNNAINPDLSPFFAHGGKLLQYHGWNDALIAPGNSINYYNSVAKELGGVDKINENYRLFMAPGMNHCNGGDGPNSFDGIRVMEQWAEQGQAPDQIYASHLAGGSVDRTRPLCAYPAVAVYDGSGSTDDASNFSCQVK